MLIITKVVVWLSTAARKLGCHGGGRGGTATVAVALAPQSHAKFEESVNVGLPCTQPGTQHGRLVLWGTRSSWPFVPRITFHMYVNV